MAMDIIYQNKTNFDEDSYFSIDLNPTTKFKIWFLGSVMNG